jgi:apoptosis-inducing factor 3
VEDGQVKVRAKVKELESNKRTNLMSKRDNNNEQTFIVVGGGPSGAVCAETLRSKGFTGRIVFVTNESSVPYDRIKLSKTMDAKIKDLQLRAPQFFDDHHIELMKGIAATSLNTQDKELSLDNGYKIKYDKIYIATGSSARKGTISSI